MFSKKITRREFIIKFFGAGVALGAGLVGYSFLLEPKWFRTKSYHLKTTKWPKGKRPMTLAVATDLHVGCPSVDLITLKWIVEKLNALNADCILLVGDFLISGVLLGNKILPEPIADVLSELKAKYGVYAVLGNHDWWEDGEGMWKALENVGIKVLENNAHALKREQGDTIWIAGLADDTTRTPDYVKTMQSVTSNDPVILMSHDPAPFDLVDERPVVTLAGHTHGGQIAAPFWGAIVIPGRAPLRYAYGHITEGNRDMIVSCGIGTSVLPVRFNRWPEILHINIGSLYS